MAKRKAAPPEEDSEEEEYYEDDLEGGSDEDEDGEAAAGGGRDFDEEEDDDDELEAEMAALESVRNERGMGRSDKPLVNNEAGLDASIQGERPCTPPDPDNPAADARCVQFALIAPPTDRRIRPLNPLDRLWMDAQGRVDRPHGRRRRRGRPAVADVNDDLARETHFYEQALGSANEAIRRLKELGVPVKRPRDYYAEMVKSDEHMKRVRAELIFEQTAQETREERRKAREQKRYGKQVQAEKLKERTLKKKESIKNLDKWRKQRKQNNYAEEDAKAPEGFEDGFRSKDSPKGRKRSTQETRQKREFKNEKFGFGGRKRVSVHASFPPVSIPFVLSFVQYRPHPA